jgi:hypothetical protein
MKWALLGVVVFGVGLLAGLIIGSLKSDNLAAVTAERDAAVAERDELISKEKKSHDLLVGAIEDVKKAQEDWAAMVKHRQDIQEELDKTSAALKSTCTDYLKSQAFICVLRDLPIALTTIRSAEFREKFHPAWWAPDETLKLLGGKWLAEEMREAGLPTDDDAAGADEVANGNTAQSAWRTVASWDVHGTKTTEKFKVKSKDWRVSFSRGKEASISIRNEQGIVSNFFPRGADVSNIHVGPGEYFLEVSFTDGLIEIQEPFEGQ